MPLKDARFVDKFYSALVGRVEWNIGIVRQPISAFLEEDSRPEVEWLPRFETGKSLADPFGIIRNEKLHIMCEEYDHRSSKGRIVSIEVTKGGLPGRPAVVAIQLPIHVSYPYLFEHEEQVYCIPETHQAREVAIYKASEFPSVWTKVDRLLSDVAALDSTVFRHKGLWWLTCTRAENRLSKLFVWYASDLFGPWKPHASNPVKSDIRSSRPAGTPFFYKGDVYRPAQDCSVSYGRRVVINRVTNLTPTEFNEEPVAYVEPANDWPYPDGVHTISSVGDISIIDAKRMTYRAPPIRKLDELWYSLATRRR